jgi:lysophospholipase L1-like esterase
MMVWIMRRCFAVLALSIISVVTAPAVATAASAPALPASIAAIGDSITQAVDACCWYGDHPGNSWSTGDASWDGVASHYERIRAVKPKIAGRFYNDAVSGARMDDAPAQAARAVAQGAQYVTILMGANDLCTSSVATMTTPDDFRTRFRAAMSTLQSGLPGNAHIFVSSIPDVYQLWELYHDDGTAQFVWNAAQICQSLLATSNTDAERQAVRQREVMFNGILAEVCGQFSKCRFDGNRVFEYQFNRSQVSKLDYFHPSLSGQATLADITWRASWWGA